VNIHIHPQKYLTILYNQFLHKSGQPQALALQLVVAGFSLRMAAIAFFSLRNLKVATTKLSVFLWQPEVSACVYALACVYAQPKGCGYQVAIITDIFVARGLVPRLFTSSLSRNLLVQ